MNLKNTSEIAKNTTEATKNIVDIVKMILQPTGIDAAIQEGHNRIIEEVISSEKYSLTEKEFFLATYKKQVKEFKNCKDIAEAASCSILPERKIEEVDPDWFSFYFDKAKLVSNESMQKIWASILAEEINSPNTISRSLIHTLSIIDKKQAESFCNICRFCWFDLDFDKIHPFIYISKAHLKKIYVVGNEQLQPLFSKWEKQLETVTSINNPKIPLSYIEENGILIYQEGDEYPIDPMTVIDTKPYVPIQQAYFAKIKAEIARKKQERAAKKKSKKKSKS